MKAAISSNGTPVRWIFGVSVAGMLGLGLNRAAPAQENHRIVLATKEHKG
jgi:hypothetical protein